MIWRGVCSRLILLLQGVLDPRGRFLSVALVYLLRIQFALSVFILYSVSLSIHYMFWVDKLVHLLPSMWFTFFRWERTRFVDQIRSHRRQSHQSPNSSRTFQEFSKLRR